jgi:hypothetical protein
LLDNIKQELAKNKEMKESIKKFRDEAKKLEESDALQEARRKYVSISVPSLFPGPEPLGEGSQVIALIQRCQSRSRLLQPPGRARFSVAL